jgi:hypothetical protein
VEFAMTYCPQYDLGLLYIYNFAIFYKILVRRFGVPSKKMAPPTRSTNQDAMMQMLQMMMAD